MLYEISEVRQIEGEGLRRWFSDEFFDLIIWLDDKNIIQGFQLCYDKTGYERSLTWRTSSYEHNKIDDGENPGDRKSSPILVADGEFDKRRIAYKFWNESKNIDKKIVAFVYKKIIEYNID